MKISKTSIVQLIFVTAIVGGYFFIDFNKILLSIQGEGEFVTQDKQCDLHKSACTITIADGTTYTLEVFPKEIPMMKDLNFKITSSNKNDNDLKLKLYATNMFMGEFIFDFTKQEDGSYTSKGTLPACPVGDMKWNADIEKSSLTKKIGARFQFESDI